MTARLLVVGLDAMESTIVDEAVAHGDLPAIAALTASATEFRLTSSMSTLPGAIWPEINTGRSAEALALFHHPAQIHTGEAIPRLVASSEIDPAWDWWQIAAAAGRRVLVVDAPQTVPGPTSGAFQLCDWGTHDHAWEPTAEPPTALADALALVGENPIGHCDNRVAHRGAGAYRDLLRRILESADRRTTLMKAWMAREHWDVAYVVFAEPHCVGHHFFGLRDPASEPYVRSAPDDLRDGVLAVYRAVDAGLGRLVAAAGSDARVVVVASHGMGKYVGGYQLLADVLRRLGLRPGPGARRSALARHLPRRARATARRVLPARAREQVLESLGERPYHDLRDPRTRATVVPNNRCGAIRLNLRGREPFGCVDPGREADELVAMLRAELLALTDPHTGAAIVRSVDTPADSGRTRLHPDLPDLTVSFREDLGPIEACTSPRVGRVEVPLWPRTRRPDWPLGLGRTGDHTGESRAWIRAPGYAPVSGPGPTRSVLDIAPTALALAGVPAPGTLDGAPLVAPREVRP